ncbi:MAG TPA: hypothetical protein VLS90_06755, partial [Thermodesulfobacteriota bacterium]|nr:hypothetical protein [Thermodesulfobacteriota bacterium]
LTFRTGERADSFSFISPALSCAAAEKVFQVPNPAGHQLQIRFRSGGLKGVHPTPIHSVQEDIGYPEVA